MNSASKPATTDGRVKAVVFDLDGTLIHTAPDLQAAANRMLAGEGRPAVSEEQITKMIGDGVSKLVERALAATGPAVRGARLDTLVARYLAHYEGHETDLSRPFPGAREVLAQFHGDGLALAVCTNKPQAPSEAILRHFGLDGYFSTVVGGDTLPGIRKPDRRHLEAVLERLGVTRQEAVMVGDSPNDMAVARAAGVPVIAVDFGYTRVPPRDLDSDALIGGLDQLAAALARLSRASWTGPKLP